MPIFFATPTFARAGVVASFVLTPPGLNLVFNPFFESGIGWTWANAYLDTSFYEPIDFCNSSIRLNLNTPTAYVSETTPHPVTPAQVYELSVDYFSTGWPGEQNTPPTTMPASWTNTGISGPHEPTGTLDLQVQFWDSTGLVLISTVTVATASPTGGLWETVSGSVTVPAGAAGMTILIVLSGETEQDWWLDNVQLQEQQSPFVPDITIGVLFAQGVMYAPSLPPVLPAAPAPTGGALSRQSWLFYNSTGGFYWAAANTPTTSTDAALGWVVTNAAGIAAYSTRRIGNGEPEVITPVGPVTISLVPPAPNVASATAAVTTLTVAGLSYYQFSGTFVNAADTSNVGQVAVVMENITGVSFDVPITAFVAPLVAGATVNWTSAPIPTPSSGGNLSFRPAFRSSNLLGVVTSPEINTSNLTVSPVAPVAAPNITSSTCSVHYVLIGNSYFWYLSGTMTMPAGSAAIASIVIAILGVDPAAVVLNAPAAGLASTVGWQTPNYPLPLAAETVTVDFTTVNGEGTATGSPYSASATVTPTAVTGLTIAEVSGARQITIGNQSTTIAVTPTLSNTNGVQQITLWFTRDGGTTLYLNGYQPFYPGVTSAIDIPMGITSVSGGLTANNFKIYAVAGAISSPGSPSSPISYATLAAAYPSVVTSNAITLLPAAPAALATLTLTNSAGAAPTQTNIYMGDNGVGLPYAQINFAIATPGGVLDPNALSYNIYGRWEDGSGNPITPGGINGSVTNTPGYQPLNEFILNNGQTFTSLIAINYPAPSTGANAWFVFYLYAFNAFAAGGGGGSHTPPFTGNAGVSLQATLSVQIGQPPTGLLGYRNVASVIPSPAVSLIPDGNFSLETVGNLYGQPSQWAVIDGAGGGVQISNDGASSTAGVQNYATLTGPSVGVETTFAVPAGAALYFAVAARSNNPTLSVVTSISQNGTASGLTPGTYTGVPLNGGGGTGATCTFTCTSTTITSITLTAGGGSYTAGTNFNVSVTVAGGSGLSITCVTGFHYVEIAVTAYNSLNANVPVNGAGVNYFLVAGSVTAWELTAGSMILLFPANVAYVTLTISNIYAEPANGVWEITNIVMQTVQNQTAGGQINTQNPQTQTSGESAVSVSAVTGPQKSNYGLYLAEIQGTDGGYAVLEGVAGAYSLELVNSTTGQISSLYAGTGLCQLALLLSTGGNQLTFEVSSSGINIVTSGTLSINGAAAVNGGTVTTSLGTKNITQGWIT